MGRPSIQTPELCASICERIALGESLVKITNDEGMPARSTVFEWLSQDSAFADRYARARESSADVYAEEIIDIADDEPDPARARVRVDARKWVASKLKSKKYGERQTLEHEGSVDFVLRAPEPLGSAAAWLEKSSSSGSHSPAPKPTS